MGRSQPSSNPNVPFVHAHSRSNETIDVDFAHLADTVSAIHRSASCAEFHFGSKMTTYRNTGQRSGRRSFCLHAHSLASPRSS